MSQELYEVLSLAARYLFALLGVLIVLRAFLWQLSSRAEERGTRRRLRDSGCIGELVVISGNSSLPEGTVFPVPWEGSLGSVRSCDVPVPCQGIRRRHLWFSWEDGSGLRIQPLSGCEAMVDGVPLDCRSWKKASPMIHGSFLQAGSALLRLRVFAALDSNAGFPEDESVFSPNADPPAFVPSASEQSAAPYPNGLQQVPFPDIPYSAAPGMQQGPGTDIPYSAAPGMPFMPPGFSSGFPVEMPPPIPPASFPSVPTAGETAGESPFPSKAENTGNFDPSDASSAVKPVHRRRSERYSSQWEEDWSE